MVGPASYLTQKPTGKRIDSHEIVVRISEPMHRLGHPAIVGKRMDILYLPPSLTKIFVLHNRNHTVSWGEKTVFKTQDVLTAYRRWVAIGLQYIVGRPLDPTLQPWDKLPTPFVPIHELWVEQHEQVAGVEKMSMSGVVTTAHLLESDLRSLHITGFDFYRSGYYHDVNNAKALSTGEDEGQIKYFKHLITDHADRVTTDNRIAKILSEY